jgi:hypothetical protein
VGDEILRTEAHQLINYIWNKNALPGQWKKSTIVSIYKKIHETGCYNYNETSRQASSYNI